MRLQFKFIENLNNLNTRIKNVQVNHDSNCIFLNSNASYNYMLIKLISSVSTLNCMIQHGGYLEVLCVHTSHCRYKGTNANLKIYSSNILFCQHKTILLRSVCKHNSLDKYDPLNVFMSSGSHYRIKRYYRAKS